MLTCFWMLLAAGGLAQTAADTIENVAPGITYQRIVKQEGGPFVLHVLEVDPALRSINLLPVHALDRASGKETVSAMSLRYGAAAAVNGGYFVVRGPYAGASNGVYQWNGELFSSGADRSALVFCEEAAYRERTAIEVANFRGEVSAPGGARFPIAGLNRARQEGELILYRPSLGAHTLTEPLGVEAVLNAAGVVQRREPGNAAIPPGGEVLSGSGVAAEWLREHARDGARLQVQAELVLAAPLAGGACKPEDIIGAGPGLIRGGEIRVLQEGFAHQNVRHPRTAFAATMRGTFLFVTVDGRQASSAGMTLSELAQELLALGALEAINLDGGGSSTMVTDGAVRNSPSDRRERPVSDGILVFSITDLVGLEAVVERLAVGQIGPELAAKLRSGLRSARDAESRSDQAAFRRELEALQELILRTNGIGISAAATRVVTEALAGLLEEAPG